MESAMKYIDPLGLSCEEDREGNGGQLECALTPNVLMHSSSISAMLSE